MSCDIHTILPGYCQSKSLVSPQKSSHSIKETFHFTEFCNTLFKLKYISEQIFFFSFQRFNTNLLNGLIFQRTSTPNPICYQMAACSNQLVYLRNRNPSSPLWESSWTAIPVTHVSGQHFIVSHMKRHCLD